jgi:hypothetical protein
MLTLSRYNAVFVAVILSVAMWATRGHHTASLSHLPDASWAIFFALGFYLRERLLLPLFLAQAALIDYLAITQFGVNSYCVTPAYAFLLPAYAALWLAGRWYAAHYRFEMRSLKLFAASAFLGTLSCELLSSGSFYLLGGRFADTSLAGFGQRLVQYFPSDLANVALYLGVAAVVHILFAATQRPAATA